MKAILILILSGLPLICLKGQKQNYKVAVVAFYNLENFYDTLDNPIVNDDEFLPHGEKNYNGKIYWHKLGQLATVIAQIGTDINPDGPAILGVAEVENDTVLTDLVHHPLLKSRNYQIVHYDSKDLRGIDVGFLYNPKYFKVETSNNLFVQLPDQTKESRFTRDILWVKGMLDGEIIHIMVNHWPSRLGGEERSMPARFAAAQVNKRKIDTIRASEPNAKIILMGDLNDDPVSPSLVKVLNAKRNMRDVQPGGLYNPWIDSYKKGFGTLAYQDAWGLFDQILVSHAWLNKEQDGFFFHQHHIFNKEFMIENIGRYKGYPMRTWDGNTYRGGYSDHFPTYLIIMKKVK